MERRIAGHYRLGENASMARFFLSKQNIDMENGNIQIAGADAHHIAYSLRMAVGDRLTVCDTQKMEYLCTIQSIHPDTVILHIDGIQENDTELPVSVHLYQSVPKGEKMEYIVQKAVELGAASITPVMSTRCIVRLDAKGAEAKRSRWQKIAAEAAKQCGRGYVPEVRMPISFSNALEDAGGADVSFFCYEGDGTESLKKIMASFSMNVVTSIAFFVGPEGGYDPSEVRMAKEKGLYLANLGKRILRCETASGFVLSALVYAIEL